MLETGCVYIAELQEHLALPADLAASANPKSSTGRIDVFTRVITDRGAAFDQVEAGYHGPLYAEISPRTFPVKVRTGSRLSQIRFRRGEPRLTRRRARGPARAPRPWSTPPNPTFQGGIGVSIDLSGFVGPRSATAPGAIPASSTSTPRARTGRRISGSPCTPTRSRALILDPGQFYILASKEAVQVPPDYAAEMVPFDPLVGEFRVHYAGFFDPGFGFAAAGGAGARAVLEVRSRDVPFLLEDGQIVGRLVYERMAERPATLYGAGAGSNYQAQGLKLSKHFV